MGFRTLPAWRSGSKSTDTSWVSLLTFDGGGGDRHWGGDSFQHSKPHYGCETLRGTLGAAKGGGGVGLGEVKWPGRDPMVLFPMEL